MKLASAAFFGVRCGAPDGAPFGGLLSMTLMGSS
jgi:hypothetical protein